MPPDRRPATRVAGLAVVLVAAVVALGSLTATGGPAGALDPTIPAPATRLSADGRSATDGRRTLSASVVNRLQAGQRIEVSGTGYDTFKGIYVALCVIPPTNQPPTPCGGGIDTAGATGASHWISSNPPPQGVGVAEPYGPGGTFRVSVAVSPTIGTPGGAVDCRRARCAVVTRNDHTRSTDRGQDIFVPITLATGAAAATTPPTTPPAPTTTSPPTTVAVTEPPSPTTVESTTSTVDDGSAGTTAGSDRAETAAVTASGTGTGSSGAAPLVLGLGAAALVAAAAVALTVRARRNATP